LAAEKENNAGRRHGEGTLIYHIENETEKHEKNKKKGKNWGSGVDKEPTSVSLPLTAQGPSMIFNSTSQFSGDRFLSGLPSDPEPFSGIFFLECLLPHLKFP
jgi:hypothetical protein